jgi:hypothetical protein
MNYHPTEKPAIIPRPEAGPDDFARATQAADDADYADALKTGEIKAADPQAILAQHADVRNSLAVTDTNSQATKSPDEPTSEFDDYDNGASDYRMGESHWADARKAWLALLARPAAERHYRTVWAAFMLGRLATKQLDPAAPDWFEKTRQFAKAGFADSLGMAADSYGWEGRAEWKLSHPEKAAPLYLNQLALGDPSAVISLKALIPDRINFSGMLNYADDTPPISDDGYGSAPPATGADQAAMDRKLLVDLATMARDPLLRKLETVHILSTESGGENWAYRGDSTGRSKRWLKVIEAAHLGKVEDAEYLGWVAYTVGDYRQAAHWLDLADPKAPVAEWLRARLDLRDGKVQEAAKNMAAVFNALQASPLYGVWYGPQRDDGPTSIFDPYPGGEYDASYSTMQWASAELGTVHLLRRDFVQALDTLMKGHLREDAAYVAESVLTTDELKTYVDKMPPPGSASKVQPWLITDVDMDDTTWLRYILGRKLVREERYAEAVPYMPPAYAQLLQKYAAALKNGADARLSKSARADNLSTAAWLARYDGMELMGTEVWPDGFDTEGAFEAYNIPDDRMAGAYTADDGNGKSVSEPIPIPVSNAEKQRLRENQVQPDVRFHYRVIAAQLTLRAAALMADNTEELADALNHAGNWSDHRDDKLANHCYDLIEKRCPQTSLGAQIIAKHWFVDQTGPWSKPLQTQEDALHKQCGIVPEQD